MSELTVSGLLGPAAVRLAVQAGAAAGAGTVGAWNLFWRGRDGDGDDKQDGNDDEEHSEHGGQDGEGGSAQAAGDEQDVCKAKL